MNFLKQYPRKRIELSVIEQHYELFHYQDLYLFIQNAQECGLLKPVQSSGSNGKKPALYKKYHIKTNIEEEEELKEELLYQLHPMLRNDYYLHHLNQYRQDREAILKLSDFFKIQSTSLEVVVSHNERSFQIWQQEKFLTKQGSRLLKNVGLDVADLNVYETAEPLAYYSHSKQTPQNILIIENKDTFYSLRKHLIEGNQTIFDVPIGTLIYGSGKKVVKGFQHFEGSVEPYLLHPSNNFYYFGDLDYEGIGIYESLTTYFKCDPFVIAYEVMLKKGENISLPVTKEKQNRNITKTFFNYFDDSSKMIEILESERYIPQEILTIEDF